MPTNIHHVTPRAAGNMTHRDLMGNKSHITAPLDLHIQLFTAKENSRPVVFEAPKHPRTCF